MKKYSLPEIIIFAVAALLPTYLVRFHLGPFPTTVLEIVLLAGIMALIIQQISSLRAPAKQSHEDGNHGDIPMGLPRRSLRSLLAMTAKGDYLLLTGSALLIIATLIGIIVAPDHRAALGIAKAYFWEPMALVWLMIITKPDREKFTKAALYGFAVSAAVVIVYGLIQYLHPALIPATWIAERRITSVFDYPNAAALYLAPLLPLLFAIPFGFVISLGAFLIILLAKSAGGLIAVGAAIFFLGVNYKKTRWPTIAVAIVAIFVVLFTPAAGLRDQILMRDWSGRVHQIGWKESLAMLHDRPLFGAGLDAFKTVVAPYHHAQGVEIFQYPHDLFLTIWSELGLLGLAGFICILAWFFRRASTLRATRYTIFLAAAMITILVHGLVDVPYFKNDLAMMFWLFIILMAI